MHSTMKTIAHGNDAGRRSVWISIPPPLLFVVAFGLGLLMNLTVPSAALMSALARAHGLGIAAVALGLLLIFSAPALFVRQRTTIIPHGKARSLVMSGPYRVTRNPMYFGLALIHVGAAILVQSYGALAAVLLPLWALQTKIIPYEESRLTEIFGDEYRQYARRTRRWI
jgi:protein-S-isoprenylcysteine O-methyltransferase Ste14